MSNPNSWKFRGDNSWGKPMRTIMSQETKDKLYTYFKENRYDRGSMYEQMNDYERLCTDHEHKWRVECSTEEHEKNVETFYLEFLPRCAEEFPEYDPDKMLYDHAMVNTTYNIRGIHRYVMSGYTSWGIRKIDTYFCERIQRMESLDEGYYIEAQIMYCDHLHIKIKENLIENLNNKMIGLPTLEELENGDQQQVPNEINQAAETTVVEG